MISRLSLKTVYCLASRFSLHPLLPTCIFYCKNHYNLRILIFQPHFYRTLRWPECRLASAIHTLSCTFTSSTHPYTSIILLLLFMLCEHAVFCSFTFPVVVVCLLGHFAAPTKLPVHSGRAPSLNSVVARGGGDGLG